MTLMGSLVIGYSAGHHFPTTPVGEDRPPKDFFKDFLRREVDQKNAFAAIKSLFPRSPVLRCV